MVPFQNTPGLDQLEYCPIKTTSAIQAKLLFYGDWDFPIFSNWSFNGEKLTSGWRLDFLTLGHWYINTEIIKYCIYNRYVLPVTYLSAD